MIGELPTELQVAVARQVPCKDRAALAQVSWHWWQIVQEAYTLDAREIGIPRDAPQPTPRQWAQWEVLMEFVPIAMKELPLPSQLNCGMNLSKGELSIWGGRIDNEPHIRDRQTTLRWEQGQGEKLRVSCYTFFTRGDIGQRSFDLMEGDRQKQEIRIILAPYKRSREPRECSCTLSPQ